MDQSAARIRMSEILLVLRYKLPGVAASQNIPPSLSTESLTTDTQTATEKRQRLRAVPLFPVIGLGLTSLPKYTSTSGCILVYPVRCFTTCSHQKLRAELSSIIFSVYDTSFSSLVGISSRAELQAALSAVKNT
ncbi:hypothetical protein RRG08_058809 [Elysia crispata]|uniref:Uncharacterized protein n=1 Tax=Elysia crispata TaxID=231223 RepID=A0AAE0YWW5_9GAST|nr:hypothetical protein RRG08_058809 [Elysia crispata]